MKNHWTHYTRKAGKTAGFTLIEFLVAMSVFVVVTGAVFTLFRKDDPLFNQQQNLAGLNITLQNAITQIQVDGVNAGTGYYSGANIPNWPVGITIQNSAVPTLGQCGDNATYAYTATCFDQLNIITSDPNTVPQHLGTAGGCASTTSSPMVLYTPGLTNAQLTTLAALYKNGDQLLLVASDGSLMTTVKLTANGSVSAGAVSLSFNVTSTTGTNTAANDPLGITTNTGAADNPHTQLGTQFCNSDWLLRLLPISYKVDDSNQLDPKLIRTQGGNSDIVAENIIGFKVGAALWNDTHDTGGTTYSYNAANFGSGYDFTIIRSIRVSIIGRTPPTAGSAITFRNSYDNGPYQIQGLSVVINPRNLSMSD
jgi:prepilin-type N-terminal cleavage/methylation domain-containing protein